MYQNTGFGFQPPVTPLPYTTITTTTYHGQVAPVYTPPMVPGLTQEGRMEAIFDHLTQRGYVIESSSFEDFQQLKTHIEAASASCVTAEEANRNSHRMLATPHKPATNPHLMRSYRQRIADQHERETRQVENSTRLLNLRTACFAAIQKNPFTKKIHKIDDVDDLRAIAADFLRKPIRSLGDREVFSIMAACRQMELQLGIALLSNQPEKALEELKLCRELSIRKLEAFDLLMTREYHKVNLEPHRAGQMRRLGDEKINLLDTLIKELSSHIDQQSQPLENHVVVDAWLPPSPRIVQPKMPVDQLHSPRHVQFEQAQLVSTPIRREVKAEAEISPPPRKSSHRETKRHTVEISPPSVSSLSSPSSPASSPRRSSGAHKKRPTKEASAPQISQLQKEAQAIAASNLSKARARAEASPATPASSPRRSSGVHKKRPTKEASAPQTSQLQKEAQAIAASNLSKAKAEAKAQPGLKPVDKATAESKKILDQLRADRLAPLEQLLDTTKSDDGRTMRAIMEEARLRNSKPMTSDSREELLTQRVILKHVRDFFEESDVPSTRRFSRLAFYHNELLLLAQRIPAEPALAIQHLTLLEELAYLVESGFRSLNAKELDSSLQVDVQKLKSDHMPLLYNLQKDAKAAIDKLREVQKRQKDGIKSSQIQ